MPRGRGHLFERGGESAKHQIARLRFAHGIVVRGCGEDIRLAALLALHDVAEQCGHARRRGRLGREHRPHGVHSLVTGRIVLLL
jgi:hypothetical protein